MRVLVGGKMGRETQDIVCDPLCIIWTAKPYWIKLTYISFLLSLILSHVHSHPCLSRSGPCMSSLAFALYGHKKSLCFHSVKMLAQGFFSKFLSFSWFNSWLVLYFHTSDFLANYTQECNLDTNVMQSTCVHAYIQLTAWCWQRTRSGNRCFVFNVILIARSSQVQTKECCHEVVVPKTLCSYQMICLETSCISALHQSAWLDHAAECTYRLQLQWQGDQHTIFVACYAFSFHMAMKLVQVLLMSIHYCAAPSINFRYAHITER